IFQTIKDVFDRQSTVIGGSLRDKEKARKVLTSIVNSLTVKMEIGSPMAAAYILRNPDHYTSHRFQPLYWKSYVNEVLKGYNTIMDYIYRSEKYKDINLYDWIRLSRKLALPKKDRCKDTDNENKNESETENMTDIDTDIDLAETDMEDKNEVTSEKTQKKDKSINIRDLTFMKGHPQYRSHYITLVKEEFGIVPNFTGGALPRSDSGNREFYCTTMLTLFKPWRTGTDLRDDQETWDDAFNKHVFSERQLQLMSFFNIRYECYDARDDYSKQRQKGHVAGLPSFMAEGDFDGDIHHVQADDDWDMSDDNVHLMENEYAQVGNGTKNRLKQMEYMRSILNGAGWLEKCQSGN
ncbi:hypothetical protein NEOLEDRAFT_1043042, partial [Neolentinus lepideus HHB14362 ss-1]